MTGSPGDNRAYHGDLNGPIAYDALLPQFVEQVLVVGNGIDEMIRRCCARPRATVYGYSSDGNGSAVACPGLAAHIDVGDEPFPLPPAFLDAIVAVSSNWNPDDLAAFIRPALPSLNTDGVILAQVEGTDLSAIEAHLGDTGWSVHHHWILDSHEGPVTFIARHESYDPLKHARQLASQGRPDWAYEILGLIPDERIPDGATRATIASDTLRYLRAIPPAADWPLRLARLARAQWLFSCAIPANPTDSQRYESLAAILEETGQERLAARLRRTAAAALGDPIPERPPSADSVVGIPPTPPITMPPRPSIRRVLVLMRQQLDYGLDVLFDGLCDVLGDTNVTEFPPKQSLHAPHVDTSDEYYPCVFQRKSNPCSVEELHAALGRGDYDLILFADSEHSIDRALIRHLLNANPHVPVALVDQDDTPCDSYAALCAYLDNRACCAVFKREYLRGVPYHPRTFPLPFAYPAGRIPTWMDEPRDIPVAWSGNRDVWVRKAYVDRLERLLAHTLPARCHQRDYCDRLMRTLIAPAFFGAGFDTVRYWEVPAHGAMLLAEAPPIEISENFQDGVHAVFFDDLPDFEAKVLHYLERPEQCAEIAWAGYEHLRKFHTGRARAQYLLDKVVELSAR